MTVSEHIAARLHALLDQHRAVVWFSEGGLTHAAVCLVGRPGLVVVDAGASRLRARQTSDAVWRAISDPDVADNARPYLLVLVPWRRADTDETRTTELFEGLARVGAAFGDKPEDTLDVLARTAMPGKVAAIDRLLAGSARVTLDALDALSHDSPFPLTRRLVGTEDPVEVAARLVIDKSLWDSTARSPGVLGELAQLVLTHFGLQLDGGAGGQLVLARWLLFSEFAFDLDDRVPAALASAARAPGPYRTAIYAVCDRLRSTDPWRDEYVVIATSVQQLLQLDTLADTARAWGHRDTFPAEDTAALGFVVAAATRGALDEARATLDERRRSLWRNRDDRAPLWNLAERCLAVLEAQEIWFLPKGRGTATADHVESYVTDSTGFWRVDRAQRLMEQSAADCQDKTGLESLFSFTRAAYLAVAGVLQDSFFDVATRTGWPPPGVFRQVDTFSREVAPALAAGRRVVYFLVDAMRYEMGRDLAAALEPLGTVRITAAATVIPTSTPFGMAALMPGAEAGIVAKTMGADVVPHIGAAPLHGVDERRGLIAARYGDRAVDLRLDDVIAASSAGLRAAIGRADLVVVRSDDIDKFGEATNGTNARRFISATLGDLAALTRRLAGMGLAHFVYAADHGHVLMPELPPGDVVSSPPGDWRLTKRRLRLGATAGSSPGVRIVPADRLSVVGDQPDVALATGFRAFSRGSPYFHEGLSLQECLVPLIVLETRAAARTASSVSVAIGYKSASITTRIFSVRITLHSLTGGARIRLVALDADTRVVVGRAADCDALDLTTGELDLVPNTETPVPIRLDETFQGVAVLVEAQDAAGAGVALGQLRLKNTILW